MDIGAWLRELGLERYEQAFRENDIDLELLIDLNGDDLKELGVTSLGHRKRLLKTIAALEQSSVADRRPYDGAAVGAVLSAGGTDAETARPAAERRQLTVMFVDLVGSTALSRRLDPEELREILTKYQNAVAGVVTRYEGQVAKYMGDGVLCYFGWPRAHEDDAERAARSGLEITKALDDVRSPMSDALSVRVGIATGLVVVGDLIGDGPAQEEAVVGETPNLAARLQAVAGPGEVVVAETTRRLLGYGFDLVALGEADLKGFDRSVTAWRVVDERSRTSQFEAQVLDPTPPMIGRDHELALIMERWFRAANGEGQVTVLIGDAGIGKSRLVRAVVDDLAGSDHYRVSYHCSPYHTDSSFYPVVQQLSHATNLSEADSTDEKLDKLEVTLRFANPQMIAALLQIDGSARYGALAMTPQQVRNGILDALSDEIRALAREKPVLFVVEDAHWVDESTLAAIEACFDKVASERVLMLITGRPTFEYGFGGHPIVSKLSLNRLGTEQTASVLSKITGGKSLPAEIVAEIVTRTDGVPLFIEELTKTIIESGELHETKTGYELAGPLGRVTIPATLHDSLMARIDRLQPVKEIAQMAACIGRQFDGWTLARISGVDERAVESALAQLEAAELVFRRGVPPDTRYVFKHALVRDVAYESLLKNQRQEIHRRLVDVFEADPTTAPELVAHHATEAGLNEKAATYWEKAGAAAQERPAYGEAINHLRTALHVVEGLVDRPEWRERELSLLVQLAQVYVAKVGYSSKEALDTFAKALERTDATENNELKVAASYGIWIAPYIGGRQKEALEHANRLVEVMETESEPIPRLISHRMRGSTLVVMGRPMDALVDLEISNDLYQSVDLTDFSGRFPQDPGVQIWCSQYLASWLRGSPGEAIQLADRTLVKARELGHANTFCYAGVHDALLSIWMGDSARIRAINEELRRVADEHDMTLFKLYCGIHDRVLACIEDEPSAAAQLDAALCEYQRIGGGIWRMLYMTEHAKTLLRTGDASGAAASVDRTMAELELSGERWAEAELHRINGEIHRSTGNLALAAKAFETALAVSRRQGARSLELRAATSLDSQRDSVGH